MQFQVASPDGRLSFISPTETRSAEPDEPWFEQGLALERSDPEQACAAYRRAVEQDAAHCGAYINLGRLLHERGRLEESEAAYRHGLAACGADGTLLFNLGIVLEDLQRTDDAAQAYRAALAVKPDMADAHFNLGCLCEARGLQQEAVRHFSAFRKLSGKS
jgi:tetratricopeptide (TPR) repeat protein